VERTHSRRVERRTPYRVPCRIRLVDPGSGSVRTVVGETVNLSSGGLAMNVGVETPVGTWVETLVPHPNGDPLFLCGKVVHVRQTMFSNFELGVAISGEHPPAF
jgi:hypothetical protein